MPLIVSPLSNSEQSLATAVHEAVTAAGLGPPAGENWFINISHESVTVFLPRARNMTPSTWSMLDAEVRDDGKVHQRYQAIYSSAEVGEANVATHLGSLVVSLLKMQDEP